MPGVNETFLQEGKIDVIDPFQCFVKYVQRENQAVNTVLKYTISTNWAMKLYPGLGLMTEGSSNKSRLIFIMVQGLDECHHSLTERCVPFHFNCALGSLGCRMKQSRLCLVLRREWSFLTLTGHLRRIARFHTCFHIDINNGRNKITFPKYSMGGRSRVVLHDLCVTSCLLI